MANRDILKASNFLFYEEFFWWKIFDKKFISIKILSFHDMTLMSGTVCHHRKLSLLLSITNAALCPYSFPGTRLRQFRAKKNVINSQIKLVKSFFS